ncbi:MAG: Druantia anti-phage system protein DruA, partial [Actinomycetota bacterium]
LILPWVSVPHLASHLLDLVTARLSRDWQHQYGHPIHLLESFVEPERFAGTCYRAAGWFPVGATSGRSRNDDGKIPKVPIKEVYLKPLSPDFQRRLTA